MGYGVCRRSLNEYAGGRNGVSYVKSCYAEWKAFLKSGKQEEAGQPVRQHTEEVGDKQVTELRLYNQRRCLVDLSVDLL